MHSNREHIDTAVTLRAENPGFVVDATICSSVGLYDVVVKLFSMITLAVLLQSWTGDARS